MQKERDTAERDTAEVSEDTAEEAGSQDTAEVSTTEAEATLRARHCGERHSGGIRGHSGGAWQLTSVCGGSDTVVETGLTAERASHGLNCWQQLVFNNGLQLAHCRRVCGNHATKGVDMASAH